jgi:hypothetical protein
VVYFLQGRHDEHEEDNKERIEREKLVFPPLCTWWLGGKLFSFLCYHRRRDEHKG